MTTQNLISLERKIYSLRKSRNNTWLRFKVEKELKVQVKSEFDKVMMKGNTLKSALEGLRIFQLQVPSFMFATLASDL
jgi:hypothetical protein